jgi:hypothetical protein
VGAPVVNAVVSGVLLAVAGGRRPRGEDVGLAAGGRLGITVAICDTGLDLEHPDHAPNLRGNPDERAGHGNDDDADGSVDDVHGADSPTVTVTRPPYGGAQAVSAATTRSAARPSP